MKYNGKCHRRLIETCTSKATQQQHKYNILEQHQRKGVLCHDAGVLLVYLYQVSYSAGYNEELFPIRTLWRVFLLF